MKANYWQLLLVISFLSTNCGSDGSTGTCANAIGNICYNLISGSIGSGNGQIQINDFVASHESTTNFAFTASFDTETGSFTFTSFANNNSENGVSVLVRLQDNAVEWQKSGANDWTPIEGLTSIDVEEEFSLSIEVHNDVEPARVIVWEGAGAPISTSEDDFTNAHGTGTTASISFSNTSFISIQQDDAKIAP